MFSCFKNLHIDRFARDEEAKRYRAETRFIIEHSQLNNTCAFPFCWKNGKRVDRSDVLLFSAAIALMLEAWDVALMFVAIFHSCFQFDKRVVFAYSGTIIALRILLAIPFQEPAMRNAG